MQYISAMKSLFRKQASFIALVICIFAQLHNAWQHPQKNPISWDVFGYYLYLPAFFLHNDLALSDTTWVHDAQEKYGASDTLYQLNCKDGTCVMKYSAGMAVLYSPAFLVGHLIALVDGSPLDGFSPPYQKALCFWSIIVAIIGLVYLRKSLRLLFSEQITALVLVLIVLASNYLFTVIVTLNMPHNYLFTLYALLLYHTLVFHKDGLACHFRVSLLIVALLALSRPTEIISIIIPLFWGFSFKAGFSPKIKALAQKKSEFLKAAIIFAIIGGIQLVYWKVASGHWIFYSYNNPGEGLEFFHPHFIELLFSWRKGWLIYTPVMVFAILGLFLMAKNRFSGSWAILGLLLLHLYISSAWTNWWYAESFSQRPLVQVYPIWAIALGFFIQASFIPERLSSVRQIQVKQAFFLLLFAGITALNLFQHWQMCAGVLKADRMTFDYYKQVFLKSAIPNGAEAFLLIDRTPINGVIPWNDPETYISRSLKKWDFSGEVNQQLHLHQRFDIVESFPDVASSDFGPTWVKALLTTPKDPAEQNFPNVVMTYTHEGEGYAYQNTPAQFRFNEEQQVWQAEVDYLVPEIRRYGDEFTFQLYREQGGTDADLSGIEILVFER